MAERALPRGWSWCVDLTCPVKPPNGGDRPHAHPASDPRTKDHDATADGLREGATLLEEYLPDKDGRRLASLLRDVARNLPRKEYDDGY